LPVSTSTSRRCLPGYDSDAAAVGRQSDAAA
jgi:hypothetical protein